MGYEEYRNQSESFISPLSENGLLRSSDTAGGVWLYAKIPSTVPLATSATKTDRLNASDSLLGFFNQLAGLVNTGGLKYRNLLSDQYREYHILASSMPTLFTVPARMEHTRLGDWQTLKYAGSLLTRKKFAFIGVKLNAHMPTTHGGVLSRVLTSLDDFAYSTKNHVEAFTNYTEDATLIEQIMVASGLKPFSQMDSVEFDESVHLLKSWWVSDAHSDSLPILVENDHLHFFPNIQSCRLAKRLYEDGQDCDLWDIPVQYPASLFFARSSTFENDAVDAQGLQWVAQLLSDWRAGGCAALGVSIRGRVEPSLVTGKEILRNRKNMREIIDQRVKHGHEATDDQETLLASVDYEQSLYAKANMPATLIDTSVCVAMSGKPDEARGVLARIPSIDFVNRNTGVEQLMAFKSMQACSPVRVRPYELHWSATVVSGSGVAADSRAGDQQGALLGLSESDRRPVFLSPRMVQDTDSKPMMAVVGMTGSGKTMLIMNLALQWSLQVPVVFLDPKQGQDLSAGVQAVGGRTFSMDTAFSKGVFDPLSVMDSPASAQNMATHLLTSVLFEGDPDRTHKETVLRTLLGWGVKYGRQTTGSALLSAVQAYEDKVGELAGLDRQTVHEIVDLVETLAANDELLPLLVNMDETPVRLGKLDGLSYFRSGQLNLNPPSDASSTVSGRLQQWLLRMMVFGMGQAVMGRDGMVILDEAWMALGKGAGDTVDEWGRLARSQRFTPVLASQKVDEFMDAGLAGAISRVLLLAMDKVSVQGEESPAEKALRLAGVEDPDGWLTHRLGADATVGDDEFSSPNWESLRALKQNGKVVRGSVSVFSDRGRSPVLVENIIDSDVLARISTSAADVDKRRKQGETE